MKNTFRLYIALLVCCFVSAAVIVLRDHLPKKELLLSDLDYLNPIIFSDSSAGGNSLIQFLEGDRQGFLCQFRDSDGFKYCGLSFEFSEDKFSGIDISEYDAIRVHLEYDGPGDQLRVNMRTFNPKFSKVGDTESRPASTYRVRASELNRTIDLSLDRFHIADWWIKQNQIATEDAIPNLQQVISIGVDIPTGNAYGDYFVAIKKISLIGEWIKPEQLYSLLFLCWAIGLTFFSGLRLFQLSQKTRRDTRRIAELAQSNDKLLSESEKFREMSLTDTLTGLLNRNGINHHRAEKALSHTNSHYSMILLDLDHFKQINDKYGHDVGDAVLKACAQVLQLNTRSADLVARWGGEEFMILCLGSHLSNAYKLAEKIRLKIQELDFASMPNAQLTASAGIGERQGNESFEDVFKRVDDALYDAKRAGRNRCEVSE